MFFSFVVAPVVLRSLESAQAARLMRSLFPSYYLVGLVSGSLGLATALAARASLLLTIPLVVCLVLVAYARQVVAPAANRARAEDDQERLSGLHVLSVRLNMVVLALLLLAGTVLFGPG